MNWALLFPGQGSQQPGMLHALNAQPGFAQILQEVEVEYGPSTLDHLDSPAALSTTAGAQLALFVAGIASTATIRHQATPGFVAGHSVGACGAAVACGALTFREGLALIRRRAESMTDHFPHGYGMAAITGLSEREVRRLVAIHTTPHDRLFVAIVNAPDQLVLAGSNIALKRFEEAGRGTVHRLDVAVPSHCDLLRSVTNDVSLQLSTTPTRSLRCPYLSNSRARVVHTSREVIDDLALCLSVELRWVDILGLLDELGVGLFLEAAPGLILTGLVRRNLPDARALPLDGAHPDDPLQAIRTLNPTPSNPPHHKRKVTRGA